MVVGKKVANTRVLQRSFLPAFLVLMVMARLSYADSITLSDHAELDTDYGKGFSVKSPQSLTDLEVIAPDGLDKIRTRCATLNSLLGDPAFDKASIKAIVIPEPRPRMRIKINVLLPEKEPLWKSALDRYMSDKNVPLRGYGEPFRPQIIAINLIFTAGKLAPEELLEAERVQSEVNQFLIDSTPDLQSSGVTLYSIKSALFPCLLLEHKVEARLSVTLKSFDVVISTRILSEGDVSKIVRRTEQQIEKDNRPSGYVNSDNLKQFVFFRSVESIGRTFTWLEKEKVAAWQRFVDAWAERLDGRFRSLSEEELFSVGKTLTETTYRPTIVLIPGDTIQLEVKEQ